MQTTLRMLPNPVTPKASATSPVQEEVEVVDPALEYAKSWARGTVDSRSLKQRIDDATEHVSMALDVARGSAEDQRTVLRQRLWSYRNSLAKALVFVDFKLAREMLQRIHALDMKWLDVEEFGLMELLEQFKTRNGAPLVLAVPMVDILLEKWRKLRFQNARTEAFGRRIKPDPLFRGLNIATFKKQVEQMELFLKANRQDDLAPVYRDLAWGLTVRGFDAPCALDSMDIDDADWISDPVHRTVLNQAIALATELGATRRESMAIQMGGKDVFRHSHIHANPVLLLDYTAADTVDLGWKAVEEKLKSMNCAGLEVLPPAKQVARLGAAARQGHNVQGMLRETSALTMMECKKGSLHNVRSGVKSWIAFAKMVLHVEERYCLPPKSDEFVLWWLACFRCPGTAVNYEDYLGFYCKILQLDTSWRSERIRTYIKGLRKRKLKQGIIPKTVQVLIGQTDVEALVTYFDTAKLEALAILTLISWEGLLRVQSEGIPLQAGTASDAYLLAKTRHSAVWVTQGVAFIRLQQRKHRPHGSFLKRPCRCTEVPQQFCLCCRLEEFLKNFHPGQRLWNVSARHFQHKVRWLLKNVGKPEGERFSLRSFRASRATCLAKQGKGLRTILELGEWKGKAALQYMNESILDDAAFLQVAVDQSDEEELPPELEVD